MSHSGGIASTVSFSFTHLINLGLRFPSPDYDFSVSFTPSISVFLSVPMTNAHSSSHTLEASHYAYCFENCYSNKYWVNFSFLICLIYSELRSGCASSYKNLSY